MNHLYSELADKVLVQNRSIIILKAFYTTANCLTGIPRMDYIGRYNWIDPFFRLSSGLSQRQFLTLCNAFEYRKLVADSEGNSVTYDAYDGFGLTFSGSEEWIKGCIKVVNSLSEEPGDYSNVLYLKPLQDPMFDGFFNNMYLRLMKLSKLLDITKIKLSSNKTNFKMVDIGSIEEFNRYGPGYKDIVLETPNEKSFLLYNKSTSYIFLPGVDKAKRVEIADILFE